MYRIRVFERGTFSMTFEEMTFPLQTPGHFPNFFKIEKGQYHPLKQSLNFVTQGSLF